MAQRPRENRIIPGNLWRKALHIIPQSCKSFKRNVLFLSWDYKHRTSHVRTYIWHPPASDNKTWLGKETTFSAISEQSISFRNIINNIFQTIETIRITESCTRFTEHSSGFERIQEKKSIFVTPLIIINKTSFFIVSHIKLKITYGREIKSDTGMG